MWVIYSNLSLNFGQSRIKGKEIGKFFFFVHITIFRPRLCSLPCKLKLWSYQKQEIFYNVFVLERTNEIKPPVKYSKGGINFGYLSSVNFWELLSLNAIVQVFNELWRRFNFSKQEQLSFPIKIILNLSRVKCGILNNLLVVSLTSKLQPYSTSRSLLICVHS